MGLKLHKNPSGAWVRMWYADLWIDHRKTCRSLGVPVEGKIPETEDGRFIVTAKGDNAFERSRRRAQSALDEIMRRKGDDPTAIARIAFESRTGKAQADIPLDELAERWRSLPMHRNTSQGWLKMTDLFFTRFAAFAKTTYTGEGAVRRGCRTLNAVTPELAAAYFEKISGEYSRETVKKIMAALAGAFQRWATNGQPNPFRGQFFSRSDNKDEIGHEPFSRDQLDRILTETEANPNVHALAMTAAFTGMRIGDICNLQWSDIDLEGRVISITTRKAKTAAVIPIFDDRFLRILEKQIPESGKLIGPVFPWAAEDYTNHRDRILRAIQPFIARAIFEDELSTIPAQITNEPKKEPPTLDEVRAIINNSGYPEEKRTRLIDTYERRTMGQSYKRIFADTGAAKSTISTDLKTIERLTGADMMTKRAGEPSKTDLARMCRKERETGKHAASCYGWHSFRATFVTLAIDAGLPVAIIEKIVGHTNAQMSLHYYRPRLRREAARIGKHLSKAYGNGRQPASGEIIDADAQSGAEKPRHALTHNQPSEGAVAIAAAIQAVMSDPTLTPEARSAAILALSTGNGK